MGQHQAVNQARPAIDRDKQNSFSGSEIVTGETIIMPMASKMLEMIRSMTIKGRNNKSPPETPL